MKRIDIMVDLETLGKSSESPIIQLGAVVFDIWTGTTLARFNDYAALTEKTIVDGTTLKWWLDADRELLAETLRKGVMSEKELITEFVHFIEENAWDPGQPKQVYLWGNGILFDNRFIKDKCERYGLIYPIHYRNDRDVKTIVEVYCIKNHVDYDTVKYQDRSLIEHDALNDCLEQVRVVSKCFRDLIGENYDLY